MINGKNDKNAFILNECNRGSTFSNDSNLDEPMDIDYALPKINSSNNKIDSPLGILNQNNTNGCNAVSAGLQNYDYFANSEKTNKEVVDDTGDLYADDDEARPTGVIIHRFTNISQYKDLEPGREKKLLSDPIKVRCLPWKILVMFRVPNNPTNLDKSQRSMGIFLQCNAECESTSWNCNAKAKITLVSQQKSNASGELSQHLDSPKLVEENDENANSNDIVRTIEHNFYSKENDWGFSNFITLTDLFNPTKGYVYEDSIVVKIRINADAPHGIDWDSKRHTGFVGLKNQGATCYLNSLLQTLFFTNKLRKAVYLMPTYSDEPSVSVPLALQRVFYELQFSDKSVGTKKLTRSFGWETLDSFMQHDAQELCRVLMDNVESKMKGTSVENTIPTLFCGKMMSYIKCKHVPMESTREENFYDIQLKVKGNRNIYDAFQDYISVETLENDNKYDAGEYGLQEAEKGVIFLKFPPVLYLQLMRFQFDFATETNVKINDRFEFYPKIDLSKYLKEDRVEISSKYFLHAVLVHSGDNHGGHYVVYINPRGDSKWYKFDDDVVSRCSIKEAIQMNFGGYEEDLGVRQCTNAYMLVYMDENARDDILCSVLELDIPHPLLERFAKEHLLEAQKRREKAESHLFTCVHLLLEEDFYGWQGFDLCNPNEAPMRRIRVSKSSNLEELTSLICETLKQPPNNIRLWQMKARKNQTTRITILDFKDNFLKQDAAFVLWVESVSIMKLMEISSHNNENIPQCTIDTVSPFDINNDLLMFLKYYDYRTKTIHYCGHIFIRIQSQLNVIIPEMLRRAHLPPNTKLLIYEERKPQNIEQLNPDAKIEQCVEILMDGNIIVFQEQLQKNDTDEEFSSVVDYFNDYFYQNDILFVDKNNAEEQGFVLRFSGKSTYEDMAKAVGHYLNYPSDKIQFFRSQPGFSNKEVIGGCIRSTFDGEIKDLLAQYPRNRGQRRIYFEKLSIPVEELENMRQVHCFYVNEKLSEELLYTVNLNRSASIKDLIDAISKQINYRSNSTVESAGGAAGGAGATGTIVKGSNDENVVDSQECLSTNFRVFEISSCKIIQQYPLDTKISQIQTSINRHLRVEIVPVEEREIESNEELIYVAHFHKDSYSTFGIPFALKIRDGETFHAVKERIKKRLDISDKEFEKWRFAIVGGRASYLPDDPDSIVRTNVFHSHNFNTVSGTRPWLGIEHKPSKRPRATGCEKPIKIHN